MQTLRTLEYKVAVLVDMVEPVEVYLKTLGYADCEIVLDYESTFNLYMDIIFKDINRASALRNTLLESCVLEASSDMRELNSQSETIRLESWMVRKILSEAYDVNVYHILESDLAWYLLYK